MQYTCRDIKKAFQIKGQKKIEVLKGVSIDLNQNDFVALKGASGAGKSTLLHSVGGLIKIDEGILRYTSDEKSLEINKLKDEEISKFRNQHIGFIFQFHHLLPEFDALENVMIPSMIAGDGKKIAKEKALQLLERSGMIDRIGHKPDELSGGEQQRVSIARALINKPDILLADEPTGNLDEENSRIIIDMIDDLRKEYKLTCMIVTHSDEVAERAGRIITLHDGKIIDEK